MTICCIWNTAELYSEKSSHVYETFLCGHHPHYLSFPSVDIAHSTYLSTCEYPWRTIALTTLCWSNHSNKQRTSLLTLLLRLLPQPYPLEPCLLDWPLATLRWTLSDAKCSSGSFTSNLNAGFFSPSTHMVQISTSRPSY